MKTKTHSSTPIPKTIITITTHVDEYTFPKTIPGITAPILLSTQETNQDGDWAMVYTYSLKNFYDLEHLNFYFRNYLLEDFFIKVIKSSGDDSYCDFLPDYADMVHQFIEQTRIITEQDWEAILTSLADLCRTSHVGGYEGLRD